MITTALLTLALTGQVLPNVKSPQEQRALLRKYAAQGYDIELKAQRTMDLNRTLQIRREYRLRLAAWQELHATAPGLPMYPVFDDTPPRSIFDLGANIRDLMNAGFMTPIN